MVGFVAYVWERPEEAVAELARHPPHPADRLFDRLDINGDDVLSSDEIPARLRPMLWANGYLLPQKISRAEFTKMIEQMRERFSKNRQRQQGAGPDAKKPPAEHKADR